MLEVFTMFIIGKVYKRRDLHQKYGGQAQGGISTPRDWPFIFIFTGEAGEQYGYRDGWNEDGVFLYTGEGQVGDMKFERGNRAIRDHIEDGKDLYLFKYVKQGHVRYEGQLMCQEHQVGEGPDKENNQRKIIVFELVPVGLYEDYSLNENITINTEIETYSTDDLRRLAKADATNLPQTTTRYVNIFYRSQAIKEYVKRRAGGVCEACEAEAPFFNQQREPYIEIHHLRRLSDGGPDDPEWVAGVCPNCHKKAHYGMDRVEFNKTLTQIVQRKEEVYS